MTKLDAGLLAQEIYARHIAKIYYPLEALKINPNIPKTEEYVDAICSLYGKVQNSPYPIASTLNAFVYACATIEHEVLHLQKPVPPIGVETKELFSLFEGTMSLIDKEWKRIYH